MDTKNSMTAKELELFNKFIEGMKECPSCKNKDNVVEYVLGRPLTTLINLARKTTRIRLLGCCRDPESKELKKYSCEKCQTKFD